MAKSKIIPSRAVSNRNIGGTSIAPGDPISGQTNDQKVIVNGRQYEGVDNEWARVVVDNENYTISVDLVKKVPGVLSITLPDGEHTVDYDGTQGIQRIRLDAYSIDEVPTQTGELKRYRLLKNGEQIGSTIIVPRDADVIQALENEIQARIDADEGLSTAINSLRNTKEDKTSYEVGDASVLTNFVFENNKEVTCNDDITSDITLTIGSDIEQGFISLLTILNMSTVTSITINNESSYTLRIVNGLVVQSGDTFVTTTSGKKLIFARCDGVDIEVLIIEETA